LIRNLAAKLRKKGFVGPYYAGLCGKLRFLVESTVYRKELVFVATPDTFRTVPRPRDPGLELHPIRAFADLEPFRSGLDSEYYPGYTEAFRGPFTWGEQAVIGTLAGKVACYSWMQFGTPKGFPTYYGRIFEREARILRVGVAPSYRRLGLSTLMNYRLLERFFQGGCTRVYIECYKYNLPSVRTFLKIGFRPVGVLTVIEVPLARGFVRWAPVGTAAAQFRSEGIEL
jgi:ribosomal protein S18 acetylase RimI-like enzyme